MEFLIPAINIFLSLFLGAILTDYLKIDIPNFSRLSFIAVLGIVTFTAINYFFSLVFGFRAGIIIAEIAIVIFIFAHLNNFRRYYWDLIKGFNGLFSERYLLVLLIISGIVLVLLFNNHILNSINGDIYTGESAYGDLPFHLSTISKIAYGLNFPPDNPLYAGKKLVYPFLADFFSAILVYRGMTQRDSMIVPGLILSLSLIILIYDFGFTLTKNRIKSFLATVFFLFNGGLGFFFFLKDYSFNPQAIFAALGHPEKLIEYSHLFRENIQWGNFLSRMIIPERSLLFGIPVGIIILRLLYFRGKAIMMTKFEIIFVALLLSLIPLLHTHTVLVFAIILPLLALLTFDKTRWKNQLLSYSAIILLTLIFALPHLPAFLNHLEQSPGFIKYHLGWMKQENESLLWFWFKNSYLFLPLSLLALVLKQSSVYSVKILTIAGLVLLIFINLFLFSPYNWDNVKFLFWAGLFFSFSTSSFLVWIFEKKSVLLKTLSVFLSITMVLTALLSIYREINVKYILFSKEAVMVGNHVKESTPKNALFLTYKLHNSPVSNLAGRSIMMGYPGTLWTQGINYAQREKDVSLIYSGAINTDDLIKKYGIDYVVIEDYSPPDLTINRNYFSENYPVFFKNSNYTIYEINPHTTGLHPWL